MDNSTAGGKGDETRIHTLLIIRCGFPVIHYSALAHLELLRLHIRIQRASAESSGHGSPVNCAYPFSQAMSFIRPAGHRLDTIPYGFFELLTGLSSVHTLFVFMYMHMYIYRRYLACVTTGCSSAFDTSRTLLSTCSACGLTRRIENQVTLTCSTCPWPLIGVG